MHCHIDIFTLTIFYGTIPRNFFIFHGRKKVRPPFDSPTNSLSEETKFQSFGIHKKIWPMFFENIFG